MSLSAERLKRLVKHRERLERIQEGALGAELRKQAERQRALDETRGQRVELFAGGGVPTGPIDLSLLDASIAFLARLERDEGARLSALSASERAVAKERDHLLERRRERKAMEALLDRRIEEDRLAAERAERKRIDELGVLRWQSASRTDDSPGGAPWP